MPEPKVKGLAFASVIKAITHLKGAGVVDQVRAQLPPELGARLALFMAASWYPLEDYAVMWRGIQSATGNSLDFPRIVGRQCLEQDLRTVHKLAFAALRPETVLGISARIFSSYYDTGECRTERLGDRRVRVILSGCTGFTAPMWSEIRGSIETLAEYACSEPSLCVLRSGGTERSADATLEVTWGK